ncbi:chromate efflux transporter [Bacillus sp. FSL W7-1321]
MKNRRRSLLEVLLISTKLGLTSFGGPIAHLGYFHEEYVRRRKWLDEERYADLVALCQFLPGPASSQVGIGIGIIRAGALGGMVSFIGFTLPSVLALIGFALFIGKFGVGEMGLIHGLKIVAVAVVAHAILGMAKNLTPDLRRKTICLFALLAVLLVPYAFVQVAVILLAGLLGYFIFAKEGNTNHDRSVAFPLSKTIGVVSLSLFFILLVGLPMLATAMPSQWLAMVDSFYRAGSFVFGGGHVVLPLLEGEFVPTGYIGEEAFLAGYGAAQAVPGPLFTFAAYLGAVMDGWAGGLLATAAIFLPAFLLIYGTLPFWSALRENAKMKAALMGANAGVVGLLIAAFYTPIWTSTIKHPTDFALAAVLFSMLAYWKWPPWVVVVVGAGCGLLFF